MKETFLHFIWQFQQFDANELITTDGQSVEVFSVGQHNHDAGPDFQNARIKIGDIQWSGQVEIHTRSSYWYNHNHHKDPAYDNVVLHVVWEADKEVVGSEGSTIPTVELKGRIDHDLLTRSNALINSPDTIPCANQLEKLDSLVVMSMQQKAAVERLKGKSRMAMDIFLKRNHNWQATAYELLARNFGFKVNAESFQRLAQVLPYKVISKNASNQLQTEALLYGMAGFLDQEPKDDHHAQLINEFEFLSKKYDLQGHELHIAQWKFLRLRPGNFPTVRLAQFSSLIASRPHLFDALVNFNSALELFKWLETEPSEYWLRHYNFGKDKKKKSGGIGRSSIENILINTTVPLLAAYSQVVDDHDYMDKAMQILETIKPENNRIIKKWQSVRVQASNAFESQALIEMHNNYCLKKKCLSCNIGVALVRNQ